MCLAFWFLRSPKVGAKPSCSFGADRPLVRQANDFSNNASPGWRERLSDRYFLGKVDVQHNEEITGLLERELRTPAFPRDSIPATAIPGIGMMIPLSPPLQGKLCVATSTAVFSMSGLPLLRRNCTSLSSEANVDAAERLRPALRSRGAGGRKEG